MSGSSSPFIELFCLNLSIVSAMPTNVTVIISAATVATTRPISTVFVISAGILSRASPAIVPHVSFSVSSGVHTTVTILVLVLQMVPSSVTSDISLSVVYDFVPVSLAQILACQCYPELLVIHQQSSVTKRATANIPPQELVIALLREHLAHRDMKFAKLYKAFILLRVAFCN